MKQNSAAAVGATITVILACANAFAGAAAQFIFPNDFSHDKAFWISFAVTAGLMLLALIIQHWRAPSRTVYNLFVKRPWILYVAALISMAALILFLNLSGAASAGYLSGGVTICVILILFGMVFDRKKVLRLNERHNTLEQVSATKLSQLTHALIFATMLTMIGSVSPTVLPDSAIVGVWVVSENGLVSESIIEVRALGSDGYAFTGAFASDPRRDLSAYTRYVRSDFKPWRQVAGSASGSVCKYPPLSPLFRVNGLGYWYTGEMIVVDPPCSSPDTTRIAVTFANADNGSICRLAQKSDGEEKNCRTMVRLRATGTPD